ncbi:MAG TPA: hypothetical protein VN253_29650, partial [Kofleriaceae bacterium]|nr:hypothetical protein [Kofleriaceae bacterium]
MRQLIEAPQIDPRQPDYDPIAAHDLSGEILLHDLFQREPRIDPWASQREADILNLVQPDLDPDARPEVECHAAICRIRLHSRDRLGDYPVVCMAKRTTLMWSAEVLEVPGPDPYKDFFLVFDREVRDRDVFLARRGASCAEFREEWRRSEQAPP